MTGAWEAVITSVSCPDATDCTAAGFYRESSSPEEDFTVDEQQGTWGTADLLGNASLLEMDPPMLACGFVPAKHLPVSGRSHV